MLWLLAALLAAALLVALWSWLSRRLLWVELEVDEVHHAITADGLLIALSRWRPRSHPDVPARRHPVLLCHGLASNRSSFDLAPDASLARHLAARGFDVFAVELRGHGKSDRPRYRWSLDDYLRHDLPAALAKVAQLTERAAVHWVGHSMGGILLYAHLARGGAAVRSGVAIGASLDYSGSPSAFHWLARLAWLARLVRAVPLGPLARLAAPLVGHFPTAAARFNLHHGNTPGERVRRLYAGGFHTTSGRLLAQLATAFAPGGLRSADGSVRYQDGLAGVTTPVLAVCGDADVQCPPEAARAPLARLGAAATLRVFGKEQGHFDHYGHFDLLVGRRAAEEVFPVIAGWLAEQDQ